MGARGSASPLEEEIGDRGTRDIPSETKEKIKKVQGGLAITLSSEQKRKVASSSPPLQAALTN